MEALDAYKMGIPEVIELCSTIIGQENVVLTWVRVAYYAQNEARHTTLRSP